MSYETNLHKAAALCSKSEHCTADVREKLISYGSSTEETEKIIQYLTKENFIDDERFAKAYAKDKFRFSKWGRIKIAYMLRMKKIDNQFVQNALEEIAEEEYCRTLLELLKEKSKGLKCKDNFDRQAKLFRFAASRGFESDLIQKTVKEILR